jgi:putative flippase GtrA
MSRLAVITLLYTAFAVIATGVNLSLQWLSLRFYQGPLYLPVAMVLGTCAGLVAKYLLDKNWIFNQRDNSAATHLRKFSGYALTGVATTALFWGCELAFNAIGPAWRFPGAALGLAIGYAAKYRLDRRFVFGTLP